MLEPTESESQYELDRFCDAMISIHTEMTAMENDSAAPAFSLSDGGWQTRPFDGVHQFYRSSHVVVVTLRIALR